MGIGARTSWCDVVKGWLACPVRVRQTEPRLTGYVTRRLLQAVLVLFIAVTAVFLLGRVSGNPVALLAPPGASAAEVNNIKETFGLDQSIATQYRHYLTHLVQGDLGSSYSFQTPVRGLVIRALPYTALLAVSAFLFAAIVGVLLGTLAALRVGRPTDTVATVVALAGQSVPSFWLGIVLIFLLSVQTNIFPPFGSGSAEHLVLPAIALGALPLASTCRLTRSSTLEVLRTEHALFERSKGVSPYTFMKHILRNAALPIVTLSGIQLGHLLSGAIVIETLFAWPGMGQLAIQAMNSADYNVVQGVVIVGTAIFVLLNLLVDLSYGWLDPRVRRPQTSLAAGRKGEGG